MKAHRGPHSWKTTSRELVWGERDIFPICERTRECRLCGTTTKDIPNLTRQERQSIWSRG